MDSRALVSLSVGATGLVLGAMALIDGSPLGLFAGVAALGVGVVGWNIAGQLVRAEQTVASQQDKLASLEETVATQVQARMSAEESVRSLGSELAAAQDSAAKESERLEGEAREDNPIISSTTQNVVVDEVTGLYTEAYFRAAVKARVIAARRHLRPVAVVLIEVTQGSEEDGRSPADTVFVADCILETLRESDTSCLTNSGLYALVLEDTPENGAVWTVERIRRRIAEHNDTFTMWAGVACYPAHAFETRDLVGKASQALKAATEWHQDRIEVAVADL